jgi:hypothetical protein
LKVKNRESLYPGRVKLTPVDAANGIYDLVRADEPQDPGTPLNKKLLDFAVAACGVTAGTATAYTLDDEFGGFELVDGAKVNFRLHVESGAGATLNVNGTGAKPIMTKRGKPALFRIPKGIWVTATYSAYTDCYTMDDESQFLPDPILSNNSWDMIEMTAQYGQAAQIWSVGDEIDITAGDEVLTLVIMGFDHDDLSDGSGKAKITFGLKNLMAAESNIKKATSSDRVDFAQTTIYSQLQNSILSSLPADLQSKIKSVNKKTAKSNLAVETIPMKLFLFSEQEVFGYKSYSVGGEGQQYSYFATASNRIKRLSNGTGNVKAWWERSPSAQNNSYYCCVNGYGEAIHNYIVGTQGICFGFCI